MSEQTYKTRQVLLYGKIATELDIAKELAKLYTGNPSRKIDPQNAKQVCQTLGWRSRDTFYRYKQIAIDNGFLKVGEDGKAEVPKPTVEQEFKEYTENNPFAQDPLINEWIEKGLKFRRNGKPRVQWQSFVTAIESVCNTCKVKPSQLIVDRKTTEEILMNFKTLMSNSQISEKYQRKSITDSLEGAMYRRVMAVRDFCAHYSITWPRGVSGIMSGRVIGHGKYSDIRFNDEDFPKAEEYIMERFGLDSDFFREWTFAVDSGARKGAILATKLEWEESVSKTGKTRFYMTVFESKTKHLRDGKWIKVISNPRLQESLRLAKKRGWNTLYDPKKPLTTETKQFKKNLKDLYKFLGKTKPYFFKRPVHSIRHIAAQRYLKKYKWNLALVAELVGSNIIDELKKSYGEMPPEIRDELLEEYDSKEKEHRP